MIPRPWKAELRLGTKQMETRVVFTLKYLYFFRSYSFIGLFISELRKQRERDSERVCAPIHWFTPLIILLARSGLGWIRPKLRQWTGLHLLQGRQEHSYLSHQDPPPLVHSSRMVVGSQSRKSHPYTPVYHRSLKSFM